MPLSGIGPREVAKFRALKEERLWNHMMGSAKT
jgi:hypothetical protein